MAFTCALAMEEGREDGVGHEEAGCFVRDEGRKKTRARVAIHFRHHGSNARCRLDHVVIGGASTIGAFFAIACADDIDDVGLDCFHVFVGKAESFQSVIANICGKDVCRGDELQQGLAGLFLFEVEQD